LKLNSQMKKLICYSLLFFCVFVLKTHAQQASVSTENTRYAHTQKKMTFAIQPFQFVNNSIRYDVEIRLGKGPGWLQFGPAFYYRSFNKMEKPDYYYHGDICYNSGYYWGLRESYSGLKGVGLDLNYKHFLDARRSFYIGVGLSYTRLNIKYWSQGLDDYIEDGLQYFEYRQRYQIQHIERFGFNNFIGYQIPSRHAFLFDVFGGYALRLTNCDENKPAFDSYMYSYGYNGIVLQVGIRIGFGIR